MTPWSWEATSAFCCFAGGIAAGIVGSVLTALTWMIGGEVHPWVRGVGTGFLILTIPLLVFAGYCMDWMERKSKTPGKRSSRNPEQGIASVAQVVASACFMAGILLAPVELQAQQTVFNVPTTDILEKGEVYFELDISAKPNNPRFTSVVPRVVVGTGMNVEIGLNVTGNIQPGSDMPTLVPAVKWKLYDGADNGWTLAVGTNIFIPLRDQSYDLGNYSYAMVQKPSKLKHASGSSQFL